MSVRTPTATDIAVSELAETLDEQTQADLRVDAENGIIQTKGDTDAVLTVAQTFAVRYATTATAGAGEEVELLYDIETDLSGVRFSNFREA